MQTQTTKYELLTPELLEEIERSNVDDQWIFLDESEAFRGYWEVDGLTQSFFVDFESLIGPHCLLTPLGLDEFLERAQELEYRVVFTDDPVHILRAYEHLRAEPAVELQSEMANTTKGFLPWQVVGYNKLIRDEDLRAGYVVWATGAGKSAFLAAAVEHHRTVGHKFDVAMIVVKAHNKIEQQRKLLKMIGVDSIILDGDWWAIRQRNGEKTKVPGPRQLLYADLTDRLNNGERVIIVTNYEKFREDTEYMQKLVTGRDCLFFWDEMPTKLSNRDSQLYKAVKSVLYQRVQDKDKLPRKRFKQIDRTGWVRHWALTATPIENSPADVFSCVTGDTLVDVPGAVTAVYRSKWRGPMVEIITALGSRLTVGPNHPVLTGQGWVKARFLKHGNQVVQPTGQIISGIKNLHKGPTTIENLFQTLSASCQTSSVERRTTKQFHGDGEFVQGKIDVVRPDSLLSSERNTSLRQQDGESHFVFAGADSFSDLFSAGSFDTRLTRDGTAQARIPGSPLSFGPTESIACVRSQFNSFITQPSLHDRCANAKFSCDLHTGQTVLEVTPLHINHVNGDALGTSLAQRHPGTFQTTVNRLGTDAQALSNSGGRFSSAITFDEIVDIKVHDDWVGYMYDLSSTTNIYYANGRVVHNCVDLMWPKLLGTWTQFDATYVLAHHPFSGKPAHWQNLDMLEAKLTFMTHRVSKEDPEVAAMFAKVIPKEVYIDWKPQHRTLYDKLTGKAADMVQYLEDANVLALMQVMQMICDAPSMVVQSTKNREAFSAYLSRLEEDPDLDLKFSGPTGSEVAQMLLSVVPEGHFNDKGHTKLERWREIIVDKHPDSKILTYSAWGSYIFPVWERWLTEWDVPYVIFNGTDKQKQIALDRFRSDPDIRVFCSGDAGADSIDIPQANVVVNYNFPWKWTTDQQRTGRADRVDSEFDLIYKYSLIMPNSVDERRKAICEKKRGYHEAIFDGKAFDEAFSATMTREDLIYLLLGSRSDVG